MPYLIKKHITPKKNNPFYGITNILILTVAVPVVAITGLSLLLYFLFIWLKSLVINERPCAHEQYHLEIELLNTEHVKIKMVEDELDKELTLLNEIWMNTVYEAETCLYRAQTTPYIPTLDGKVLCFFLKEQPGGAILQVLNGIPHNNTDPPKTQIVFLNYQNLEVSVIDDAIPYYLYNKQKNAHLIMGFNKKEKIRIELVRDEV